MWKSVEEGTTSEGIRKRPIICHGCQLGWGLEHSQVVVLRHACPYLLGKVASSVFLRQGEDLGV